MQAVAGEELHPAEAGELVVAQGGVHSGGRIHRLDAGEVLEFCGESGEVRRGFEAHAFEDGQPGGVERVELCSIRKLRVDE